MWSRKQILKLHPLRIRRMFVSQATTMDGICTMKTPLSVTEIYLAVHVVFVRKAIKAMKEIFLGYPVRKQKKFYLGKLIYTLRTSRILKDDLRLAAYKNY